MQPFARTREEIIYSMCMTYDHAYGAPSISMEELFPGAEYYQGPSVGFGYTDEQRQALWNQMAQIFDNDIYPNMEFRK